MAKSKQPKSTENTDALRGGTDSAPVMPVLESTPVNQSTPGGTNALSPNGSARPMATTPEPPSGDKESDERQDPQRALEGGRTKASPDVAAQRARDEANIPASESQSGIDEGDPRQIPPDAPTGPIPSDPARNG